MEQDRAFLAKKDTQILDLEAPRNLIRQRLDEYKYPVLSLPNETVAEIFLHFIPPYPDTPPTMGLESPVVLTLICRQWRDTALSTPALWPAIELTSLRLRGSSAQYSQLWLERSGLLPLSIHYSYGNEASEDGDSPLLSTLVKYRSRWEHAGILLPDVPQINAIHGPMPLLRTLSFIVANRQTTPTTDTRSDLETIPPFVFETPALSSLSIMGFHTLTVIFPWSQLTSLSLDRIRFPAYMPILRQATPP
ncbi:F-box domain-containing protein [Favolaschia claudopus]|uniref:F-box domain-containing protein n=1 Tax=Favolaschia claudopus TaxID=2862362 RepID=A0AAW0CQX8_9AGAR